MEYKDLYLFPKDHPPAPYDYPVLVVIDGRVGEGFLPKDLSLYAVGWLEKPGFTVGQVPEDCITALLGAYADHIISDGMRGVQSCAFCGNSGPWIKWRGQTIQLLGHGHYLVQKDKSVFMAPALVLHYILEHHYCPPPEFIQATLQGRFLADNDLRLKWK